MVYILTGFLAIPLGLPKVWLILCLVPALGALATFGSGFHSPSLAESVESTVFAVSVPELEPDADSVSLDMLSLCLLLLRV